MMRYAKYRNKNNPQDLYLKSEWLYYAIENIDSKYDYITTSAKYLVYDDLETLDNGVLKEVSKKTKETLCRDRCL